MLTREQNRKRFYKVAYILSIIEVIISIVLTSMFIIIYGIAAIVISVASETNDAFLIPLLLLIFSSIPLIVITVLKMLIMLKIKKAFETCNTPTETDHFTLAIVSIFFMTLSSIFLIIAVSQFHE